MRIGRVRSRYGTRKQAGASPIAARRAFAMRTSRRRSWCVITCCICRAQCSALFLVRVGRHVGHAVDIWFGRAESGRRVSAGIQLAGGRDPIADLQPGFEFDLDLRNHASEWLSGIGRLESESYCLLHRRQSIQAIPRHLRRHCRGADQWCCERWIQADPAGDQCCDRWSNASAADSTSEPRA